MTSTIVSFLFCLMLSSLSSDSYLKVFKLKDCTASKDNKNSLETTSFWPEDSKNRASMLWNVRKNPHFFFFYILCFLLTFFKEIAWLWSFSAIKKEHIHHKPQESSVPQSEEPRKRTAPVPRVWQESLFFSLSSPISLSRGPNYIKLHKNSGD